MRKLVSTWEVGGRAAPVGRSVRVYRWEARHLWPSAGKEPDLTRERLLKAVTARGSR